MSIHEVKENDVVTGYRVIMKGAPEVLLTKCSHIYIDNQDAKLNEKLLAKCFKALNDLTSHGHFVVGYCDLLLNEIDYAHDFIYNIENYEEYLKNMRFLGFISITDPPRAGVLDAVEKCKTAGIRVLMVTNDHPITAKVIARNVGIIDSESSIDENPISIKSSISKSALITGDHLNTLSNNRLDEIIKNYKEIVFARTSPKQKLEIVKSCQRVGEFVAVTGNNINDLPALRKADIGIAMGLSGSDVSKEAADMVLLDDNFSTILSAIEEGRLIYNNLKKSLIFTLSTKSSEISPFIFCVILGIPLPISVMVILCIDIITEILPTISLAYEKAESDLMKPLSIKTKKVRLVNQKYSFNFLYN